MQTLMERPVLDPLTDSVNEESVLAPEPTVYAFTASETTVSVSVTVDLCNGIIFENNPVNFTDAFGLCTDEEDDGGIGFWDWLQGGLDAGGIVEPTPFCDLGSSIISMFRGNWGDAGWSLLGVVPYVGDLGKAGKYGGKALKYSDEAADAIKGAKRLSEFRKHHKKLKLAQQQAAELAQQINKVKGAKKKKKLVEQLQKLQKGIKGHEKEILQKWPGSL